MRNHSGTAIELWEEKGSYRFKQPVAYYRLWATSNPGDRVCYPGNYPYLPPGGYWDYGGHRPQENYEGTIPK